MKPQLLFRDDNNLAIARPEIYIGIYPLTLAFSREFHRGVTGMPLVYGDEQYVISGIPLPPTKPEGDVAAGSLFQLPTNSAFQFPKADCGKN